MNNPEKKEEILHQIAIIYNINLIEVDLLISANIEQVVKILEANTKNLPLNKPLW